MARKIEVQLVGDASSLNRAFRTSSSAGNQWNRDISRSARGAVVATVGFRGLGRSIAFASGAFIGGAGLTVAVKTSIQSFNQFNDTMEKTVGLAGVAQKSVKGFSQQILKLSENVGKSPQELAQAFYFIASSGIAASKAMNVLTQAAKASVAGLGDTQTVADAITSAINAYGAANLSAAKATDILVATVREGKGEAASFAPVIGNVAALASQLGVSFDQVGAALAAETRLGIDAETSATQLQRVFTALIKVPPKSADAFKSVGLNAVTLRKQLGGPNGLLIVLAEVQKAFKLSEKGGGNIAAAAKAFGDVRALRGVLALVGKQGDATLGIFNRLAHSSGSLKTAFDAVSKDSAQQFRKLRASAEVTGIAIGAIFAPLAGKVADALAGVADSFTAFFQRFSAAKTLHAKLDVIWTGIKDAARSGAVALGAAISQIDFKKVWANARGIADGFQAQLEQVNFSALGKRIGDAFSKAAHVALPAAKDIGARLNRAISTIDVNDVGKKLGPLLAAAVVSAFATLTDPSFWIKNWQLAISVAVVAFPVGRLGALLEKPFAIIGVQLGKDLRGLGETLILKIGEGIDSVAPGLGRHIVGILDSLPKAIQALIRELNKPFAKLEKDITERFQKLNRITRFVVKVTGIDIAIHSVQNMVDRINHQLERVHTPVHIAVEVIGLLTGISKIKDFISSIVGLFKGLGTNIVNDLKILGLEAVLAFIQPFDVKIPGLKDHLIPGLHSVVLAAQKELDKLQGNTVGANVSAQITDSIRAGMHASAPEIAADITASITDAIHAGLINSVKNAVTKTVKTATKLDLTGGGGGGGGGDKNTGLSKAAQHTLDLLNLAVAQAGLTRKIFTDDLAANAKLIAFLKEQVKLHKDDVSLMDQLVSAEGTRLDLLDQQKAAEKARRDARQFRALGLDASGNEITPGVKGLRRELNQVGSAIQGTFLDTNKTNSVLRRIRNLLSGHLGKLSQEVRAKIKELLDGINSELKNHPGVPLTKTRSLNVAAITAGLGLSEDEAKALQARLSHFNTAGQAVAPGSAARRGGRSIPDRRGDIVVEHQTNLDGREIERSTTRYQQVRTRQNPPQRRGRRR